MLAHSMPEKLNDCMESYRVRSERYCDDAEYQNLYAVFFRTSVGRRCLHLAAGDDSMPRRGWNWQMLDLGKIESHVANGAVCVGVDGGQFDVVLCTGMGMLSEPSFMINEARRLLKSGGQLWVQTSIRSPLDLPHSFCRPMTPGCLRSLLKDFDEIFCGTYRSASAAGAPNNGPRDMILFYGLKQKGEMAGRRNSIA